MGIYKKMFASVGILALLTLLAGLAGDGDSDARELNVRLAEVNSPKPEPIRFSAHFNPQGFVPISSQDARLQNGLVPFSAEPIEPALPLFIPTGDGTFAQVDAAVDCMTAAIYYEAGAEPASGKRAVAQIVLNRVRHPAFPNSVCDVVFEGSERSTGCQFTFTCDGSLLRKPTRQGWNSAREIAQAALAGAVESSVGMSTHYHADYVRPYWAASLDKVTQVGPHIFYRWRGSWGRRQAFNQTVQLRALHNWPRDRGWFLPGNEFEASPELPILPSEEVLTRSPADEATTPTMVYSPPEGLQPRADRTRGMLIVDENPATLLVD